MTGFQYDREKIALAGEADLHTHPFSLWNPPMSRAFVPGIMPADEFQIPGWWFAFRGNQILVRTNGKNIEIPRLFSLPDIGLTPLRTQFLGTLDRQPC